jgi:tetratricopeptide (TPR) repeat protein
MNAMGRFGVLIVLVLLAAGLEGPAASAQQPPAPPAREPDEEVKPYYPPPARKSVEIGDYYFRKKKYKAALSRYHEAATTDPHYPRAYLGLGKVYEKIGLKQKALLSYQRYLDELPSTKDALEAKDVQRAVSRLEKELKSSTSSRQKTVPPQAVSSSH